MIITSGYKIAFPFYVWTVLCLHHKEKVVSDIFHATPNDKLAQKKLSKKAILPHLCELNMVSAIHMQVFFVLL